MNRIVAAANLDLDQVQCDVGNDNDYQQNSNDEVKKVKPRV